MADARRGHTGRTTPDDGLSEGDLRFLDKVAEGPEDDMYLEEGDPPGFPMVSVIIATVVFGIVIAVMSYTFMEASQYAPVMAVGGMDELSKTDDAVKAMKTMSDIYGMRYNAYGIIFMIYAMVLGVIALVHHAHVRRWEDEAPDDSEDGQ